MQRLETDVLVIGGGSTGTGVARDAAMRGFRTVLVEKRDLTHGTTGRYHGLLHSGGRYVVKDPESAKECIAENRILRRIMPHSIEDTGGLFVITPWDDPAYGDQFRAACAACGVPCEEMPVAAALHLEPRLNPKIQRAFALPDGAADSFLATHANAESARAYGAEIRIYHEVTALLLRDGVVWGARIRDLVRDEEIEVEAAVIVNAAGAWAGRIARLAGCEVNVIPAKGVMVAMNHRLVNTVLNRCKLPADGDILVPIRTVCVIGTTDHKVPDPERYGIEPWEVTLLLEEGEKLVPGLAGARVLRAWAGVRPLYSEQATSDTRDVSRTYALLDHESRDAMRGFVTITGGKWTTYRQMAEVTLDAICRKLGVERPCRTHLEALPEPQEGKYYTLGAPLADIESAHHTAELLCECELVTQDRVERAVDAGAVTLDDVRRDVRLGMGPCQGGFCTYRAAGLLQERRKPDVRETNLALLDFLQERWKGLQAILWGAQLHQARLDELIYLGIMNADHLETGGRKSPLTDFYFQEDSGPPESQRAPAGRDPA
ncbi:MAG TPA: anaerobic glycerol-3-phosphate dehydrogenase subunit GlpA [bacterium]|nr:anaerobic glycerol-3-phosphate dehydrogenase subunit GlpA [bacterium]